MAFCHDDATAIAIAIGFRARCPCRATLLEAFRPESLCAALATVDRCLLHQPAALSVMHSARRTTTARWMMAAIPLRLNEVSPGLITSYRAATMRRASRRHRMEDRP